MLLICCLYVAYILFTFLHLGSFVLECSRAPPSFGLLMNLLLSASASSASIASDTASSSGGTGGGDESRRKFNACISGEARDMKKKRNKEETRASVAKGVAQPQTRSNAPNTRRRICPSMVNCVYHAASCQLPRTWTLISYSVPWRTRAIFRCT